MAKRIDVSKLEAVVGTLYPPPFDEPCRARGRTRLGDPAGLTQFGVNLLRLPPGAWSSQRHWHTGEDEFVYVLSGEVALVSDAGEEVLRAGDAAGFPANDGDGHCLQNRSGQDAVVLEIGSGGPAASPIIPISTWWRRPAASRSPIPIATAPRTKGSGGGDRKAEPVRLAQSPGKDHPARNSLIASFQAAIVKRMSSSVWASEM